MDPSKSEKEDNWQEQTVDFPYGTVIFFSVLIILLLAYGIHGVIVDDLNIPSRLPLGVHYHGIAAWTMFGSMLSFSATMFFGVCRLNVIKEKQKGYLQAARIATVLGMALAFICISV